jgi:regulator of protease activity HflC (stomatin/prohibitin superfamily)
MSQNNLYRSSVYPRNLFTYSAWGGFALFIGIIIFYVVSSAFFTVKPGEKGLMVILGKLQEDVLGEGTHFIFPLVSQGKLVDVRVQRIDVESNARTKDLQEVKTKLALNWKIDPANIKHIYRELGTQEEIVTKIINPVFDATIKSSIPSRTLENLYVEREQVTEEIKNKVRKQLVQYGLILVDISFVWLSPSAEFTKATEERLAAEQQAITRKIVVEQEIKEAEFKLLKNKKEAEALVIKAKGEAEAQQLLQQTLTPELLQKKAIEKWNGQYPTVVGGSSTLPLINISPSQVNTKP